MRLARPTSNWLWMVVLASVCPLMTGCSYDWGFHHFFDPSRNIRQLEPMQVNLIHESMGPMDQTDFILPGAETPTPDDLRYTESDYVIGPTDVMRISVLDLLAEGLETVLQRQVSESGYVDLPLLEDPLKITGLTKLQAVEVIKDAYRPNVLKDPAVSVEVLAPRGRTFSILGAVTRPGPYNILRNDFTLMDALALAGDLSQTNVDWIYVIRRKKPAAAATDDLPPLPEAPPEAPEDPTTTTAPAGNGTGAGEAQDALDELERSIPKGMVFGAVADEPVLASDTAPAVPADVPSPPPARSSRGQARWVYADGKWVEMATPAEGAKTIESDAAGETTKLRDPYGWGEYDLSDQVRIIAVNLPRLKAGDPSMNVIIRPNDIVNIPPLQIGEFYVMGEVSRPGVYSLTGRRVTVKMAIAAAGNIGPLGWPNNSVLVRRIGRDQEQRQQIKLADIIAGKEPDVLLKPDDVVMVGTHWVAPFMAVWRNAFRMTYGFGFIYDRNYSERDFEIPLLLPSSGFRR